MSQGKNRETINQEAYGIFDSHENLQKALQNLENAGIPRIFTSVLGSHEKLVSLYGTKTPPPEDVSEDPEAPHQAPVKQEEINTGASAVVGTATYLGAVSAAIATGALSLPVTIAVSAAAGLASGAAGVTLLKIFGDQYSESMAEQIEAGGIVLWIKISEADEMNTEKNIIKVLEDSGAKTVGIHQVKPD